MKGANFCRGVFIMLRFPFDPRHVPSNDQQRQQEANENKNEQTSGAAPPSGLSPELSLMLSMAMKDGMKDNNMLKMFQDILPFVSENERKTLQSILHNNNEANNNEAQKRSLNRKSSLSGYSKQGRQNDLLNIIESYAEGQGGEMMQELRKGMQMQKDYEEMFKKFQNMGNSNNMNLGDMMQLMSMLMPNQDMSQFKNMQNMMNLFGNMNNMNNMKPEDMLKFMNLNKNQ